MALRRAGLSLIEVLAAIALLSVLLGTVVVASTRHASQLRRAQDRLAAQEIADELLSRWFLEQQGVLRESHGAVPGRKGWRWRLAGRIDDGLEPFGLHVGRLEVAKLASSEPLVVVEFASSSYLTAAAASRSTP